MTVERPPGFRIKFLGGGFGYIVKQGCPSQPQIIAGGRQVVEDLQGDGGEGELAHGEVDDKCGAHTVPYIESKNRSAQVEHEATTSRISEDQLFYCRQRGISEEDAVSMIVNGFCKEVLRELPMEFAVEAQKLLGVSLEGSVG